MQFVFMRHATRASSFDDDCPLNALGLQQAAGAARLLHPRTALPLNPRAALPQPTDLFTSPKLRARQTLQPLSIACAVELKVDERLDERNSHEAERNLTHRIREFLNLFSHAPERVVYACSHMDWLEAAMPLLDSDMSPMQIARPWAAGEFRVFEVSGDGVWHLVSHGVLPST